VTDQRFAVPGAELAFESAGAGPVAVQLHGLSSSREADLVLGFDVRSLADRGHRLVRYDARGHGGSTGRAEPDSYRWSALADDLIALLDGIGATDPVDAIGASMGTATIIHAAIRYPERFRRLVLFIPPTAWETRAPQGDLYRQGADLIEAQGIGAFVEMMAAAPLPPLLAERGVTPMPPQLVPELAPSVFRGAALSDLPDPASIATLRMPTLLLPWAGDPGHPLSTAQRLHELIPDSLLEPAERGADVDAWPDRVAAFLA
jgi:3-oxoadipate enol-lactonase